MGWQPGGFPLELWRYKRDGCTVQHCLVCLYLGQPIGEGCEATRAKRGNGAVTASGLVEGSKLKRPQGRRRLAPLSSGRATALEPLLQFFSSIGVKRNVRAKGIVSKHQPAFASSSISDFLSHPDRAPRQGSPSSSSKLGCVRT